MVYYGGGHVPTQAEIEAQREAYEQAKKDSHAEALKGHEREISDYRKQNQEFPLETNFSAHDIDKLKSMIEHANPDGVDNVSKAWNRVHDQLVGEGGSPDSPSGDSAYGQLDKAVEEIMERWEGESAKQFQQKAKSILQQIANSASHAQTVSRVMIRAADDLRTQRDAISKIEKPAWYDKAWDAVTDSGRDDKITQEDIKNGNLPKDLAAKANEGYIGAEKEKQLQAAAVMETLGRSYVGYSQQLKTPVDDPGGGVPPSNPEGPMPTPIPAPSGSASAPRARRRPKASTGVTGGSKPSATTGPRDPGVSGGQQAPGAQTKVDSLPSGFTGRGADDVSGGGVPRGTGAGGGAGSAGGIGAAGGAGGAGGGGMLGTGAAGAGSTGGRAGMSGGAGASGGRGGAAAAGERGALARAKGGTAGAPKGISGGTPATQGGTGLGKGRGSTSSTSGRGMGGMLGGSRGNQRPGGEEREQGTRPDYLVEDEETWAPEDKRSVPKTIE